MPRLLLLAQDRTPLLRFVDTIRSASCRPPDGGSTFAAYSQKQVGLGDFGTNRRRLRIGWRCWTREVGPTG